MIRLQLLLAVVVPAALALLPMSGTIDPLTLAAALAGSLAILLLACSVGAVADPADAPARIRTVSLRERARRTAFLRLRDPDSAGHARPRAPSLRPRGRVTVGSR